MVNRFIIPAGAVIIAAIEHFSVVETECFAVAVEGIVFVEGVGGEVKGGAAADEHGEVGEGGFYILIDGATPGTVRVKGQLVREGGVCAQQRIGDAARGVKLHTLPGIIGEAVFLSQGVNAFGTLFLSQGMTSSWTIFRLPESLL